MTESTVIENKKLVNDAIDLMSNVVKINREAVSIETYIIIEEQYEMSIDLIAESVYGTNEAIDLLCKFNGIENPLSIKEGDVIAVPNLSSLISNTKVLLYKSILLEKEKPNILKSTVKSTQNTPNKKTNSTRSVVKTADGVLIF